jgi:sialate O-acetylesterase
VPGSPTQQWALGADGALRNVASGLCMTAPNGASAPGPLVTAACESPLADGQVFASDPTAGLVYLARSGGATSAPLALNGSFGSWNYGWLRPYSPLGVAPPAGSSPTNRSGQAPWQAFVMDRPSRGMILANATIEDFVCVDAGARAPVGLVSSVFGSHMVLQRDIDNGAIFGWASPGAAVVTVVVSRAADNSTVANISALPSSGSGAWRATLPRMVGGLASFTVTISSGSQTVVLEDVLFGDVYMATGQSNMQFTVDLGVNVSAELAAADGYSNVRLFTVGIGTLSAVPLAQLQTLLQPWTHASSAAVGLSAWGAFSAVGWYFCRDLFDAMGGEIPVGCIGNNWGGTPIECWSDAATLSQCPGANREVTTDSTMYNSMFVPYIAEPGPMPVAGWIWYQGEANAGDPVYACELAALIASWRAAFASPTAWFGVVQLAAWDCCPGSAIALTRDIQLNASLTLTNVGFATAADLGDIASPQSSIHPRFKQQVGARLASARAAALVGRADPLVNPRISSVTAAVAPAGSVAVVVAFEPSTLGSGRLVFNASLAACPKGVPTYNCETGGFMIQTAVDGAWRNASATLDASGRALTLTALADKAAGAAVAASFGWSSWPLLQLARVDTGQVVLPFLRPVEALAV